MELLEVHREIEERWDTLDAEHERLRAEAESRVVVKAWSSMLSSWERPEPFYAERSRQSNPRLSKKRPKSLAGVKEYGFDDRDRIVIARTFDRRFEPTDGGIELMEPEVPFDVLHDEYFVYLGEDAAESYRFQSQWLVEGREFTRRWVVWLAQVNRQWFDSQARLVRYDSYHGPDQGTWESERYEYREDGRLVRVLVDSEFVTDEGVRIALPDEEFTYDEAGELAAIREVPNGDVIWRRPPKSLALAERLVEDALVDVVAAWAKAHWPQEPVFALGLGTTGATPYEPAPGFLTVAQRDAYLEDGDDEYGIGLSLWNPADYETFDPDFEPSKPPEVAEAFRLLQQEAELTDDETSAPKLLGRVAARLAEMDWTGYPRDDDFVVFAIDMEIESETQIAKALRRSAPKHMVKAFKKRGWLEVLD